MATRKKKAASAAKKPSGYAKPGDIIKAVLTTGWTGDVNTIDVDGKRYKVSPKAVAEAVELADSLGNKSVGAKLAKARKALELSSPRGAKAPISEGDSRTLSVSAAGTVTIKVSDYLDVKAGTKGGVEASAKGGKITLSKA